MKFYNKRLFHIGVIVFSIVADQLTKLWALARFTNETGAPNHDIINVIGELVRFQLVFNKGAAFSSRPQDLMPFLSPTVFFILISIVACVVMFFFYRNIDKRDWMSRLGVVMILGGGGSIKKKRMRLKMVVDFIDCDLPDFIMTRFPTFNVADSFVTVGVAIIILSPVLLKKVHKQIKEEKEIEKQKLADSKTTEANPESNESEATEPKD